MSKAIFFDFWGTVVENGVWSPIKQVKNILGINVPFPEYVVRMERAMMTSKFPELKEAFKNVCQEFNTDINEEKLEQLIGIWNKSWMLAHPYEEIKEVLGKLKNKYQLVLISNTDCFSVPKVIEKFSLDQVFDQIFLSYEIGLIKTDNSFFQQILRELELAAEDCVMVGDSIQSDIMAAKQAGIKAILIDRKNTRDFHPKIKNLKELEDSLKL